VQRAGGGGGKAPVGGHDPIVPCSLTRPMADDDATTPEQAPRPCPPCRGTGRIVSRLGGSASTVTCPWCEGTGQVIPGHDAQAARRVGAAQPPDDAA
jgi:DnaJ-class molecular chaperone